MSETPPTGRSAPDPTGSAGGPTRHSAGGPARHAGDDSPVGAAAPGPGNRSAGGPGTDSADGPALGSGDGSARPRGRSGGYGLAAGRRRFGDRGVVALAAVGVVLVLAAGGVGVRAAGSSGAAEPPLTTAQEAPADPSQPARAQATKSRKADGSWGPVSGQSPVAAPTDRASAGVAPTGVRIPAIGVNATSLIPLKLMPATGELEAPVDFDDTGWYAAGPVPGEPGPAVLAAHVDSRAGPAVFFRLRELKAGDAVYVPRSDGVTVKFTVTGVERYPKNAFPTQKVHGPTPDRALRLITCGGSFDSAKRSYRDNIVAYAVRS